MVAVQIVFLTIYVSKIEMTEIKVETAPEPAKALLALNPTQEAEFKKRVQEVQKNKPKKVGKKMNRVHLQTKVFI